MSLKRMHQGQQPMKPSPIPTFYQLLGAGPVVPHAGTKSIAGSLPTLLLSCHGGPAQRIFRLIPLLKGRGRESLGNTPLHSQIRANCRVAMPKKLRICVTGEKNVGKTAFPTSGWERASHSFKSITQVYSARKCQSKYLHATVIYEGKLNRMPGEKKRTRVLLEALGTTPGLLATCLSFTSLFILSVTPASFCCIIWSFPESHSIRQGGRKRQGHQYLTLWGCP